LVQEGGKERGKKKEKSSPLVEKKTNGGKGKKREGEMLPHIRSPISWARKKKEWRSFISSSSRGEGKGGRKRRERRGHRGPLWCRGEEGKEKEADIVFSFEKGDQEKRKKEKGKGLAPSFSINSPSCAGRKKNGEGRLSSL